MYIDKRTRFLIQSKIRLNHERQADVAMRLGLTPGYFSMMLCGTSPMPSDVWTALIKDLDLAGAIKGLRSSELKNWS